MDEITKMNIRRQNAKLHIITISEKQTEAKR